jgi:hypothetical protein
LAKEALVETLLRMLELFQVKVNMACLVKHITEQDD